MNNLSAYLQNAGFACETLNPTQQVETLGVKPDVWPDLAAFLKTDTGLAFDFLSYMVGLDEGEDGLSVLYRLYSYQHGHTVVVKVRTDRETAAIPTVSHLWQSALLEEREVFDFFGIRFLNHPDMRRLYLRNDWNGHPLRKDYDADPTLNPVPTKPEKLTDAQPVFYTDRTTGTTTEGENRLFEKEEYVVNFGPQHPATHGVLHFQVSLEGEIVRKVDPHCGYIHRGIEKMCESLTYPQTLALTDRLDYLSAHQNRHALCACIEEALGLEIPLRAQYIRAIMDELTRIQSHLLFYSTFCMDMGGLTPFFYGFRDREKILNLFEDTTGGRLIQNYNMIGGVAADLHPDFLRKTAEFIRYLPTVLPEYHKVFTGNVIVQQRTKGIGLLTKEEAASYGITGPSARASGLSCDLRKLHPYGVYDRLEFNEVLYQNGDCFDRYCVRMDEIHESLKLLDQLLTQIPDGDYALKTKPLIKLPEGDYFKLVEASRGLFGVFIESRGDKFPYRVKFRSTGLPLVGAVDHLASGHKIADLIVVGASLDYVVPDIDR
ncbi:MAG: NADH-quinone oxidoreductase subunit D [Bacteroidales bacterium]|nr:NADH-quinone oxidoreductase subunit D [Bacteroidales bacterium]